MTCRFCCFFVVLYANILSVMVCQFSSDSCSGFFVGLARVVCHIGKRICPPDLANDDVSVCVGTPLNCIDSLHAFRKVDVVCLPYFVANHGSERSPSSYCMPGKDDCCDLAGSEDFLCGYMLALIHHIISLSSFMRSETQDTLV